MQGNDRLRVLCVTPSGIEGRGGIDRLYTYLRGAEARPALAGIDLRFGAARGGGPPALWPLAFPIRLVTLARQMRAFRPHVVHVNFANRGSAIRKYAVLRLAEAFGARTIAHLHDSLPAASLERGGREGRLFLAICHRADRVVALGSASATAIARWGIPAERIRVVLNGSPDFAGEAVLPKPPVERVSILLAGRVGAHKGVGVLLESLAHLARRDVPDWHCTVAGDGEVEAYRAIAAGHGLAERVRFTGWLDSSAVHALMREAAIVVLPSIAEALPLSLVEGACAGAALVATPVGNVAEIVRDGETGLLVARDPAALADALARLVADSASRARLGAAARRRYRECLTVEAFARSLRAVYAELAPPGTLPASCAPEAAGDAPKSHALP